MKSIDHVFLKRGLYYDYEKGKNAGNILYAFKIVFLLYVSDARIF